MTSERRKLFLCALILHNFLAAFSRNLSAETTVLDQLLNLTEYDRARRPPGINNPNDPCIVEIDMLLNSVGPLSNLDMELTSSFYLRQEWLDPRLAFQNPGDIQEPISVSISYMPKMWMPDLFFTLGRDSYRHETTTPNLFLRLWSNGSVLYSQRITATMKCQMDLSNFPHDFQNCKSPMMSYSYTTKDLIFRWSSQRQALSVLPSAYLAEFVLSEVGAADCTETFATGTFTCLESVMTLERQMGFYMTQTYIPSILIVMLSWAAFWIDHEAVPARISVGLLTVLTITTQSSGARSELPRVNYIKAIDVWMSANLIFVFTAYMEYAVVTITSRRYKRTLRNAGEKTTVKKVPDITKEDLENPDSLNLRKMSCDPGRESSLQDITVSFSPSENPQRRQGQSEHHRHHQQQHQEHHQYVRDNNGVSFAQSPNTKESFDFRGSNDPQRHHQQQRQKQHQHQREAQEVDRMDSDRQIHPQQAHHQHRRATRTGSVTQGASASDGSYTNLGFIGDIFSMEGSKKQPKHGNFFSNLKRRKRAKRIYMRNYGRRVDFHSRYLFPCAYVIFNIIYWSYYLRHS